MSILRRARLVVATGMLVSTSIGGTALAATLTLRVQVLDQNGAPMAGVPLSACTSLGVGPCRPTDVQGRCDLTLDSPPGDRAVVVQIQSTRVDCGSGDEDAIWRERFGLLADAVCIEYERTIAIAEGVAAYDVLFRLKGPAVAFGTAVEAGVPVGVLVHGPCFPGVVGTDEGAWSITVPRGERSKVYLAPRSGVVVPVSVDATAGAESISMGAVDVSAAPHDATARVVTTQYDAWFQAVALDASPGVSLIAEDGSRVRTIRGSFDPPGTPTMRPCDFEVPHGAYFVVPGRWGGAGWQAALLDAIAAGADLTNSGVPKVTAVEGQTVEIQVDLMAAYRALHNLRVYSAQP